ncbi:hypothetical protein FRC11_011558, partial [Ceratobasidium sp. 423]
KRDIIALLPFPSTLVALKLTGQAIKDALKGALSHPEIIGSGQFPVFSGIKVKWDSTKAPGSRDPEVLVPLDGDDEWEPINVNHDYFVLTNDYLAEGNIGFSSFKSPIQRFDSDLPVFQVLLSYLETDYALNQIFTAESFNDILGEIPDDESDVEEYATKAFVRFTEFGKRMEELEKLEEAVGRKRFLIEFGDSIKRAAAALYDHAPDSFIPRLVIEAKMGRMVDAPM